MAVSEAATPSRVNPTAQNAYTTTTTRSAEKNLVTREFDLAIRAFFPTPTAPAKFNPTSAMSHLLRTMLKDEPSLVLRTPTNDQQIVLETTPLPTGEKAFKQYFCVSTPRAERSNTTHVCIGCHVLSNRSLGSIKFHSSDSNLLTWLKKAKVFIEADSLGTERPITIGYFTKIDPSITHLANYREHLTNQLMLIEMDAETALDLAPHLKTTQLEAMSNGDEFTAILPPFELYKTRLSHGRDLTKITTEVIGVKGTPKDAKLLGEFFARMATELGNDARDGVFVPKGAVHLLGIETYARVLHDNSLFLDSIATIPVNMEYAAWFALIDPNNTNDNEPISIHDHLLRQPWFLRIESVARTKCFIVTTKPNLPVARAWIDEHLQPFIRKSIPEGIDPPSSCLPRRLDKPTYTKTSQSYADILKRQFSLAPNPSQATIVATRPPRKRQATIFDFDSATDYPPLDTTEKTNSSSTMNAAAINAAPTATATPDITAALLELKTEITTMKMNMPPQHTTPAIDYAAELVALKQDLQSLRNFITIAVEQLKTEIASIHADPVSHEMETMETDTDQSLTATKPDISDLIADLKQDMATVAIEMRAIVDLKSDIALIKSHSLFRNLPPINQQVPVT